MLEQIKREPALIYGLVSAVIALILAFGVDLSNEQVGTIMAVVVAIMAIITRASVTPNVTVAAKERDAGLVAGQAAPEPIAEGAPVEVTEERLEP